MKLSDSDKFKKDFKKFSAMIDQIKLESAKIKYQKLLKQFESNALQIDKGHDTGYNGYINPQDLKENVSEMLRIRNQFKQLEKDLNNT